MSGKTIGYIIYYVLFAAFAIFGTVRRWPMQILVGIILLVEIICCVGGDDAGPVWAITPGAIPWPRPRTQSLGGTVPACPSSLLC